MHAGLELKHDNASHSLLSQSEFKVHSYQRVKSHHWAWSDLHTDNWCAPCSRQFTPINGVIITPYFKLLNCSSSSIQVHTCVICVHAYSSLHCVVVVTYYIHVNFVRVYIHV